LIGRVKRFTFAISKKSFVRLSGAHLLKETQKIRRMSFILSVTNKPIILGVVILSAMMLNVVMLSVTNKPIILSVVIMSGIMLNVVRLNAVMLNAVYIESHK